MKDITAISSLERQVIGLNKINAYTIEALKQLLPQLEPFVGKKVKLASGGSAAKFTTDLLKVPYDAALGQSYRTHTKFEYQSLVLFNDITLKTQNYQGGGHGVNYYKREVTLCEINDEGILLDIRPLQDIIDRHGLAKIHDHKKVLAARTRVRELEDEVRALKYIALL